MSNEISDLVMGIADDVRSIVADEVALLRAEVKPAVRRIGVGSGLVGAAGLFLGSVVTVSVFLMVAGFGWLYATTTSLSGWACGFFGALTAIGLLLIVAVALAFLAKGSFSRATLPSRIGDTIIAAIESITGGLSHGQDRVANEIAAGTSPATDSAIAPVGGTTDSLR